MPAPSASLPRPGPIGEGLLRTIAALLFAWLAAAACSAAGASLLVAAGAPPSEASVWSLLGGLLLWLVLGVYACGCRSLPRAWLLPGALALLGAAIAWSVDAGGAL